MQAATAEAPAGRFERTTPYLRPDQLDDIHNDIAGIEATLAGPSHVTAHIQDRAGMVRQVQAAKQRLMRDQPTPYPIHMLDDAARREAELRTRITEVMPTQQEMRKNPPGAVDKHRGWERARKADILEWRNIRRRLHASGHIDDRADGREVGNIEQFRPAYASHELNMDNAQIPGKQFFFGSAPPPVLNAAPAEDAARMLAERDQIAALMAQFPNATVAEFQAIMRDNGIKVPAPAAAPDTSGKAKGAAPK